MSKNKKREMEKIKRKQKRMCLQLSKVVNLLCKKKKSSKKLQKKQEKNNKKLNDYINRLIYQK